MLQLKIEGDTIYSHIRQKFLQKTPEEIVRQEFVCELVNNYGYSLEQMDEEYVLTNSKVGCGKARADIVIWKNEEEKKTKKKIFIVVECKSKKTNLSQENFYQGINYSRWAKSLFFIVTNGINKKIFKSDNDSDFLNEVLLELIDIPPAGILEDKNAIKYYLSNILDNQTKYPVKNNKYDDVIRFPKPIYISFLKDLLDEQINGGKLKTFMQIIYFFQRRGIQEFKNIKISELFSDFYVESSFKNSNFMRDLINNINSFPKYIQVNDVNLKKGKISIFIFPELDRTFYFNNIMYFIPRSIITTITNNNNFYKFAFYLHNNLILQEINSIHRDNLLKWLNNTLNKDWKRTIERGINSFLETTNYEYNYTYSRSSKCFEFTKIG